MLHEKYDCAGCITLNGRENCDCVLCNAVRRHKTTMDIVLSMDIDQVIKKHNIETKDRDSVIKHIICESKKYNNVFYLDDVVFGKAVFINRDYTKLYFKIDNIKDYFCRIEKEYELDIILRTEISNDNISLIFAGFRLVSKKEIPDSTEASLETKKNYLSRKAISKRWNESFVHPGNEKSVGETAQDMATDHLYSMGEILAIQKKEDVYRKAKLKTFKEELKTNADDFLEIKLTCATKGTTAFPTLLKEISDRIHEYNRGTKDIALRVGYKFKLNVLGNEKILKEGN